MKTMVQVIGDPIEIIKETFMYFSSIPVKVNCFSYFAVNDTGVFFYFLNSRRPEISCIDALKEKYEIRRIDPHFMTLFFKDYTLIKPLKVRKKEIL